MTRIYLLGRMAVEGAVHVDESSLPGTQGRVLLAALSVNSGPVSRGTLASILWDGELPERYDQLLNPVVSKLRRSLRPIRDEPLLSTFGGAIELRRSSDLWIDIDEATRALDASEGAMRQSRPEAAWPAAAVATSIFRRPFLEGVDLIWADEWRRELKERFIRGLQVATDVWLARGDSGQAVVAARQLVSADSYRESSHERLIRAHLLGGNRAAALQSYTECAALLREELGVEPSPLVQSAYEAALGTT